MKKDTVYIDIEDDITDIIEKVGVAKEKIVAMVPPKRSTTLSSAVNLKLIHKTAQDKNKRVVMITTDKTLVALAGGIGMYVAPNLQSAPSIPVVTAPKDEMPSDIIKEDDAIISAVGAKKSLKQPANGTKTDEKVDDLSQDKTGKKLKKAFGSPKVPDFNSFKKKVFILVLGGFALVGLLTWAFYFAPRAHITLEGQTNRLATDLEFTVDTTVKETDFDGKVLSAVSWEIKREVSESFTPTGEQNIGDKASGTMTLRNCSETSSQVTIPASTKVSSGSFTFVTDEAVTLPVSIFSFDDTCLTSTRDVDVTASEGGDDYNLSARDYTVVGYSGIEAEGSNMSGGTTELVKVVSKTDIDKATEALQKKIRSGAKEELLSAFEDTTFIIEESFGETIAKTAPSVPVGERADTASVSTTATFYMLGVERQVMEEFLRRQQQPKLAENQSIFHTGLDEARLIKTESKSAARQSFQLKTNGFAGPDANVEQLRAELAGKGFSDAKEQLEAIPGVTEAKIDLSPFWVFSLPRRASSIIININIDSQVDQSDEEGAGAEPQET